MNSKLLIGSFVIFAAGAAGASVDKTAQEPMAFFDGAAAQNGIAAHAVKSSPGLAALNPELLKTGPEVKDGAKPQGLKGYMLTGVETDVVNDFSGAGIVAGAIGGIIVGWIANHWVGALIGVILGGLGGWAAGALLGYLFVKILG